MCTLFVFRTSTFLTPTKIAIKRMFGKASRKVEVPLVEERDQQGDGERDAPSLSHISNKYLHEDATCGKKVQIWSNRFGDVDDDDGFSHNVSTAPSSRASSPVADAQPRDYFLSNLSTSLFCNAAIDSTTGRISNSSHNTDVQSDDQSVVALSASASGIKAADQLPKDFTTDESSALTIAAIEPDGGFFSDKNTKNADEKQDTNEIISALPMSDTKAHKRHMQNVVKIRIKLVHMISKRFSKKVAMNPDDTVGDDVVPVAKRHRNPWEKHDSETRQCEGDLVFPSEPSRSLLGVSASSDTEKIENVSAKVQQ